MNINQLLCSPSPSPTSSTSGQSGGPPPPPMPGAQSMPAAQRPNKGIINRCTNCRQLNPCFQGWRYINPTA
uniref:Uncharacterized protein n=1 Tax=Mycena chlorophos TaxID=658473 RepID=A0ABQ0LZP0_MYCCL|nr:predicted protein [Mycena chlorophos]